jgi:hypothetical protein
MKKLLPVLLVLLAINTTAQNKDFIVSTEGVGAIKLDMTQGQLEKLLGTKVPLTNPWDTISGAWVDSAKIRYRNIDVELRFVRRYSIGDSFQMVVNWIKVSSPLCKTKEGIGIGSDKLKIITAYEGYYMELSPVYLDEDRTKKSRSLTTISVRKEEEGNTIWFNLLNKKVVSFQIFPVYDDEE